MSSKETSQHDTQHAGQAPAGRETTQPAADPSQPTYSPVGLTAGTTLADVQSLHLTNVAAGLGPTELYAQTVPPSAEQQYPKAMYAKDGTTKAAKNQEEETKLQGEGYSDQAPTPPPAAPPNPGEFHSGLIQPVPPQFETALESVRSKESAAAPAKSPGETAPAKNPGEAGKNPGHHFFK